MGTPQLTTEQIAQVSALTSQYIFDQRTEYSRRCVPLTAEQRRPMSGFFQPNFLGGGGIIRLDRERVANPGFYPKMAEMGFTNLPNFSLMAAITFSNVIVSDAPLADGLPFHELVHVEQFHRLGSSRFAELCVEGFLTGSGYEGIPLEIHGYGLGARSEARPQQRFAVSDELLDWI